MNPIENLKQKYYDLIPRSFKTKLDVYLFFRCTEKRGIGTFEIWEFNMFRINDKILESYNKAWQLKGGERLSEGDLTAFEIDAEIEKWTRNNQNYIVELLNGYKILFITDYFPFSEFEDLYSWNPEKRICAYCKITDKDIEILDKMGKINTKRTRGFTMEIDRITPNNEYTADNCVLACYWCNNAKTDEFSSDEFSEHIGPGIQSVWKERNS